MNNNQPNRVPQRGASKPNPTRTYSQTKRPTRSKSEIARRVFLAKCILVAGMLLVLGGVVFLLCRSGIFSKKTASPTEVVLSSLTNATVDPSDTTAPAVTETTPTETTLPDDLTGYYVILDPGHGGYDRGCGYPINSSEIEEETVVLKMANFMAEDLRSRGATVYMTRETNDYVSLYNRIAQAHLICLDIAEKEGTLPFSSDRAQELRGKLQKSVDINDDSLSSGGMGIMVGSGVGPDLLDLFKMEHEMDHVIFIALHLNADYDDAAHRGCESYYVTDDSIIAYEKRQMNTADYQSPDFPIRDEYHGRDNEQNAKLAQMMYDYFVGEFPDMRSPMNVPVDSSGWAVIREVGLSGVLFEAGFLSDPTDRAFLGDDTKLQQTAVSLGDAIEAYFKEVSGS